jgi:hypothetical protein
MSQSKKSWNESKAKKIKTATNKKNLKVNLAEKREEKKRVIKGKVV